MESNIENEVLPSQELLDSSDLNKINDEVFLDLIDVAGYIFKADVTFKAKDSGEPRNISVKIPVTDVKKWSDKVHLIEEIAGFLSGDKWRIEFSQCKSKLPNTRQIRIDESGFDNVTLLSGGLDSFCGAYNNIKNGYNSIYCGYKINKYETKSLNAVHDFLIKNYNIVSKRFNQLRVKKHEHTQRTRSFLFFTLAFAQASIYNAKEVLLYENGVLSLNPELDSRKTTKTTHPKTIYMINNLLKELEIDISIKHPFLFRTKGEIVSDLSDEFKRNIILTNTCGSARQNKRIIDKSKHCGFCIPCILRKISMSAYDNEKYDIEYNAGYNTILEECNSKFKIDFKSSNEYFKRFNEKIKDKSILNQINIKEKYYENKDYLELTWDLLNRFGKEIDTFYSKYPL